MFDWLEDFIDAIVTAIEDSFVALGQTISNSIWDLMLRWVYEAVFDAVSDFFTMIGNMGAEIFELGWIQATVELFTLFGWALFVAGVIVAIFDMAIEYQNGRANPKTVALNILKGFFACSLTGILPIELYKFCITLQNVFSDDAASIFSGSLSLNLSGTCTSVLVGSFASTTNVRYDLFGIFSLIAFAYCVVKIFFQNIKRGGILLIQIAVGSLYMFSVPRGYSDGYIQWIKQVVALCVTAFLQTTLLFLGLMTFTTNMLLGLGIMLASGEVPRIAQLFGLDTSAKIHVSSVVHTTTTAVNLAKTIVKR